MVKFEAYGIADVCNLYAVRFVLLAWLQRAKIVRSAVSLHTSGVVDLEIFYSPGWDASPSQGYPTALSLPISTYSPG